MNTFLATAQQSQFAQNLLTPNGTIDTWAKDAQLDYTINNSPMSYETAGGNTLVHPSKQVLYHSNNNTPLGIVSNNYKVVQPIDVLSFYEKLASNNGCELQAAGYSKQGAGMWAMADTGKEFRIKGQDNVRGFLMFYSSNDGTAATTVKLTSYRMACANQLNVILNQDAGQVIRITHASNVDWESLYDRISYMLDNEWKEFNTLAEKLSDRTVDRAEVIEYYENLYNDLSGSKKVERMINSYLTAVGQNLKSADGTAWGLVNGVTRFLDHDNRSASNQSRFENANFGAGARLKAKAWNQALQLAA